MTRRHVHLADELTDGAHAVLARHDVSVRAAQYWLDTHTIDGCTFGPDLFLPACALHDYLVRTGVVPRHEADDIARDVILALAAESEDERVWRRCGAAYAWVFWVAVCLGGVFGVGHAEVEA